MQSQTEYEARLALYTVNKRALEDDLENLDAVFLAELHAHLRAKRKEIHEKIDQAIQRKRRTQQSADSAWFKRANTALRLRHESLDLIKERLQELSETDSHIIFCIAFHEAAKEALDRDIYQHLCQEAS